MLLLSNISFERHRWDTGSFPTLMSLGVCGLPGTSSSFEHYLRRITSPRYQVRRVQISRWTRHSSLISCIIPRSSHARSAFEYAFSLLHRLYVFAQPCNESYSLVTALKGYSIRAFVMHVLAPAASLDEMLIWYCPQLLVLLSSSTSPKNKWDTSLENT